MQAEDARPGTPVATEEGSVLKFALRALRYPNYRRFFGGQSVSLIGTWMTRVATSWLVYRITGSAFLLGLVGFSGQIPALILGPLAGVWVDRWNRRRVLLVTQILSMVQSFILAGLALSGHITVNYIIGLSIVQGAINAFDMPARQAMVVELVEDRSDLANAIALNSSMVNGARLIGPSLAGIVIAAVGEGYCFLIDGISYIAVLASLLMMHLTPIDRAMKNTDVWAELKEGWQYVSRFAPIRDILLLLSLASLVGLPYTVLMPVFAGNILHGGPSTLGILMGASGVGALGGALLLAARRTVVGLGTVVATTSIGFGVALMLFGWSRWIWLSMPLMVITGFAMMQQMAASNTILQTIVDEDKRGRVMSFYSMAFMGVAPFGSLGAGVVASRIGAPVTLMIGGACCVIGGLWFCRRLKLLRKLVRPIYQRLGIIPEVASGIQAASFAQIPPEE